MISKSQLLLPVSVLCLLLLLLSACSQELTDIYVDKASGKGVTLTLNNPCHNYQHTYIEAPPPGSGLPGGRYLEVYLPDTRLSEKAALQSPFSFPLSSGNSRNMLLVSTSEPALVLYIKCAPNDTAQFSTEDRSLRLDF